MSDFAPPKKETFDKFISLIKAVSSEFPGASTMGALAFQFLGSPYQHRQDQWMEEVGKALKEMTESEGLRLEDLQTNNTFIDIVLKSTQVAMRNHHEEKRSVLIKIIRNAARPDPDEVFLQTALNFIDTSTSWHLLILKFVASPTQWEKANNREIPNILGINLYWAIEQAFPDLKDHREISTQVVTDLWAKGLIETHPERQTGVIATPTLESIRKGNVTWPGRRILAILS